MVQRTILAPDDVASPTGYSHGVLVSGGRLIFTAGQVALDHEGTLIGPGDVGAQTRQVFANLGAVLASAGASFADIVELTSYLVGEDSIAPYRAARQELSSRMFPDGDFPASTLLVIQALARPELLVEVKAVAVIA